MKVREIVLKDFRSFRGERRISFVNTATDMPHPIVVLAGSNGTGKTTILEVLAALLELVSGVESKSGRQLLDEALATSLVVAVLEFAPYELTVTRRQQPVPEDERQPLLVHVAVGKRELVPADYEDTWEHYVCRLTNSGSNGRLSIIAKGAGKSLQETAQRYSSVSEAEAQGGLLLFPWDRKLSPIDRGAIEPPTEKQPWVFRFANASRWIGSLQQFWVWQNYLDLERGAKQPSAQLTTFVATVERVLGSGRTIEIQEGRVTVPTPWRNAHNEVVRVGMEQLPSGEQQVLLLFGELARRRRRGMIVAIDEVENSLHPTLQRQVMANLRQFAHEWDVQVLVTTHSREVINTVRGSAFVLLDDYVDRFDAPVEAVNEGDD